MIAVHPVSIGDGATIKLNDYLTVARLGVACRRTILWINDAA
jgi:hypothetical protein